MKVDYRLLSGGTSKAYLDEEEGEVITGTDKYTDDPVAVRWTGLEWVEVATDVAS